MELELELKHIAHYLPYNLSCLLMGEGKNNLFTILGADNELIQVNSISDSHMYYSDVFPILRPLSDLNKEIEINDEKFIPINYFVGEDKDIVYNACLIHNDFSYFPYNLVELLFKWHFDVFGLIEKGLAIDINTLK